MRRHSVPDSTFLLYPSSSALILQLSRPSRAHFVDGPAFPGVPFGHPRLATPSKTFTLDRSAVSSSKAFDSFPEGIRFFPRWRSPREGSRSFIIHHSLFIIRHSSFVIHHLSFVTHHSSFIIHPSSFIIRHSSFFFLPRPSVLRIRIPARVFALSSAQLPRFRTSLQRREGRK